MSFDYKSEYKLGNENKVIDAFSHWELLVFSNCINSLIERLMKENSKNPKVEEIRRRSINGDLTLKNCKGKLFIFKDSDLIPLLLTEYHGSKFVENLGLDGSLFIIGEVFVWKNIRKDIKKFVDECLIYRKKKTPTMRINDY